MAFNLYKSLVWLTDQVFTTSGVAGSKIQASLQNLADAISSTETTVTGISSTVNNITTDYLQITGNGSQLTGLASSQISGLGSAALLNANNSANNLPVLDGSGHLSSGVLPAASINNVYPVSSQSAMLALSADVGDTAVRSDISESFMLRSLPASTLANWVQLLSPTGGVSSFNARSGSVTPQTGDYSASQITGLGTAATHAATDFDASGSASTVAASAAATYLPLSGGTITGDLNCGGHELLDIGSNSGSPTCSIIAANYLGAGKLIFSSPNSGWHFSIGAPGGTENATFYDSGNTTFNGTVAFGFVSFPYGSPFQQISYSPGWTLQIGSNSETYQQFDASGRISFPNLPTSPDGLATGTLYSSDQNLQLVLDTPLVAPSIAYVDAVNGTDGSQLAGNPSLPFASIAGAVTAATLAGMPIKKLVIGAGTYNDGINPSGDLEIEAHGTVILTSGYYLPSPYINNTTIRIVGNSKSSITFSGAYFGFSSWGGIGNSMVFENITLVNCSILTAGAAGNNGSGGGAGNPGDSSDDWGNGVGSGGNGSQGNDGTTGSAGGNQTYINCDLTDCTLTTAGGNGGNGGTGGTGGDGASNYDGNGSAGNGGNGGNGGAGGEGGVSGALVSRSSVFAGCTYNAISSAGNSGYGGNGGNAGNGYDSDLNPTSGSNGIGGNYGAAGASGTASNSIAEISSFDASPPGATNVYRLVEIAGTVIGRQN